MRKIAATTSAPINLPTSDVDVGEWLTTDQGTFSKKASAIWQNARAVNADHPYLRKYGLEEGLIWTYGKPGRVDGENIQNAVVVPYFKGSTREITSIRFILVNEDGDEHDIWLRGDSEHVGAYARIGVSKTDTILVTSSHSDGLSLFEATGYRVAVAEDSVGLQAVAATLASALPGTRIVICGIEETRTAAEVAARMVGAALAVSTTGNGSRKHESFNSLYQQSGVDALCALVDGAGVPRSNAAADGTPMDVAPWPLAAPDTTELVMAVEKLTHRFSVLTEVQGLVVALWVLVSHVMDLMPFSPILGLFSPTKGCGKTTLLGVLEQLVHRPVATASMSAAFLYHMIERCMPTMLIDEGDTFMRKGGDLTGIINSGHARIGGYVGKMSRGQPKTHPAYCAKVSAMIGRPADTTYSRCLPIHLRRKLPDETVEPLYHADATEFAQLKSKIVRWAIDHREAIKKARPPRLKVQFSRMADNWVPLLMVALVGGDELLKRAVAAGERLSAEAGDQLSDVEHLLRDIKATLDSTGRAWIWTHELLTALCQDDDKPWRYCNGGRPLSSRMLGDMLAPFGIASKDIREGEVVKKGYRRAFFEDAFARYVSSSE
jgi:hypothetical protein